MQPLGLEFAGESFRRRPEPFLPECEVYFDAVGLDGFYFEHFFKQSPACFDFHLPVARRCVPARSEMQGINPAHAAGSRPFFLQLAARVEQFDADRVALRQFAAAVIEHKIQENGIPGAPYPAFPVEKAFQALLYRCSIYIEAADIQRFPICQPQVAPLLSLFGQQEEGLAFVGYTGHARLVTGSFSDQLMLVIVEFQFDAGHRFGTPQVGGHGPHFLVAA